MAPAVGRPGPGRPGAERGATSTRGVALNASHPSTRSGRGPGKFAPPPDWIADSPLLSRAHALAAEAHDAQQRATDQAPFLSHVVEVGQLLHDAGYDAQLVAAGLLHDAVERGTLREARLHAEVDAEISALVLALTEDAEIDSFADRKQALREQVEAAGSEAITIFAADKLSDIRGLKRGIDVSRDSTEARIGTTVEAMAGHYRDSVAMIEQREPDLVFVVALRAELDELAAAAYPAGARSAERARDPAAQDASRAGRSEVPTTAQE